MDYHKDNEDIFPGLEVKREAKRERDEAVGTHPKVAAVEPDTRVPVGGVLDS